MIRSLITSSGHILDISTLTGICSDSLSRLDKYSEISVNAIIASDRILSTKTEDVALSYLAGSFQNIEKYLVENRIEMVFGEATWAGEFVCAAVCRMLDIPYLVPATVRYPSGRFAFFEGIFQKAPIDTKRIVDMSKGRKLYSDFISRKIQPFYLNKPKSNLLYSLYRHLVRCTKGDGADMTMPSFLDLVGQRVSKTCRKCNSSKYISKLQSGRYVYLPLHVEREASIDVLGGYYRSMEEFVRNVSRAMPYGVSLVVKEHEGCYRKPKFYKTISSIPGVKLVRSDMDSHSLIKNAEAVISVSGTACYEAGLFGVDAYTFADMYFNALPSVKKCTSYEELYSVLKNVSKSESASESIVAFLSKLYSVSFEGYAESETVYADALSDQNVSNVTIGFNEVIDYYSSSKSATADSICSRFI